METAAEAVQRVTESLSKAHPPTASAASSCPACDDTGWVNHPTVRAVVRCECAVRRIAAGRTREVLEQWPEYAEARLDSFFPRSLQQSSALRIIRENPEGSYYLHGNYSAGKTFLMIAQYRHVALSGMPCLLRPSRQLADELRKAEMSPPAGEKPFESPVLEMISDPKHCHLFVDDLEKTPARTDFRAEATFYWLDTLKRHCHGLTVTSNRPLQELTGILGDAAVARIDRICTQIRM
jgi:DNA replication protein DnaC